METNNNIFITKIELKNIACFEQWESSLSKINLIKAKNGSGKTTITKALIAGVGGGNQVELITDGENSGEIGIMFSNGIKLNKILSRDGKAKLSLIDANDHIIPKSQTFLDSLVDSYSFNPVQIITATKKERIKILLEALPMRTTKDDLRPIFNGFCDSDKFPVHVLDLHAFDAIEFFRTRIYDDRTDVNSQLKKAKATNDSLKSSMPNAGNIENLSEILSNAKGELHILTQSKDTNIAIWQRERNQKLAKGNTDYNSEKDEITAWKQSELERINQEYNSKISGLNQRLNKYENSVKLEIDTAIDLEITKFNSKSEPIKVDIIRLEEQQKNQAAYLKQAEIIKENQADIEILTKKADSFTASITKLEALKSNFLTDLPIPGLNVENGEIFCDGIAFDSINTQKQMSIVANISKLRAGKLGFVFVDGFERLDSENQKIFFQEFAKTDLQLLVTEVSNTEMTIEKVIS